MAEITAQKIAAIGLFKDSELVGIVHENGKPTHYKTTLMGNSDMEELYECNKATM